MRRVREDWNQTPQEFGYMLGQGLLSAVLVERWELGMECPPDFVMAWVNSQYQLMRRRKTPGLSPRYWRYRVWYRPVVCPSSQDAFAGYVGPPVTFVKPDSHQEVIDGRVTWVGG